MGRRRPIGMRQSHGCEQHYFKLNEPRLARSNFTRATGPRKASQGPGFAAARLKFPPLGTTITIERLLSNRPTVSVGLGYQLMRIVLCYPVEPRHVAQIAAAAGTAELVDAGQERVAAELLQADVFCGHAKVPVDWDAVVRGGRLRWIQSSAAGLDHCLVPSVVASDIIVTSASGVLADQVAEHALGLATALSRSFPVFFRAQQAHEFVRRPTRDLHHSTVGIVGFGGVGRQNCRAGRAAQDAHPGNRYVSDRQARSCRSAMAPRQAGRPADGQRVLSSCAFR